MELEGPEAEPDTAEETQRLETVPSFESMVLQVSFEPSVSPLTSEAGFSIMAAWTVSERDNLSNSVSREPCCLRSLSLSELMDAIRAIMDAVSGMLDMVAAVARKGALVCEYGVNVFGG